MGYKTTDPCIKKAMDDERLFVLMARDGVAPEVICEWIKQSIRIQPRDKLIEALDAAIEMVERRSEFHIRKTDEFRIFEKDFRNAVRSKDIHVPVPVGIVLDWWKWNNYIKGTGAACGLKYVEDLNVAKPKC